MTRTIPPKPDARKPNGAPRRPVDLARLSEQIEHANRMIADLHAMAAGSNSRREDAVEAFARIAADGVRQVVRDELAKVTGQIRELIATAAASASSANPQVHEADLIRNTLRVLRTQSNRSNVLKLSPPLLHECCRRLLSNAITTADVYRWLCDQGGRMSARAFYRFAASFNNVAAYVGEGGVSAVLQGGKR